MNKSTFVTVFSIIQAFLKQRSTRSRKWTNIQAEGKADQLYSIYGSAGQQYYRYTQDWKHVYTLTNIASWHLLMLIRDAVSGR